MIQIITTNKELLEVLVANGINIICDDQMRMTISDEDMQRVAKVVEKIAPAASCDYVLQDCIN